MLQSEYCTCVAYGRAGNLTVPLRRDSAIQVLVIWAISGDMRGISILAFGAGCSPIVAKARRVLGPHSLECGQYVMELHVIHLASGGQNDGSAYALMLF